MFVHDCTACGKSQLIFPSQVRAFADTPEGVGAVHTCWCGAEQTHLFGAAREELIAA